MSLVGSILGDYRRFRHFWGACTNWRQLFGVPVVGRYWQQCRRVSTEKCREIYLMNIDQVRYIIILVTPIEKKVYSPLTVNQDIDFIDPFPKGFKKTIAFILVSKTKLGLPWNPLCHILSIPNYQIWNGLVSLSILTLNH